MPNFYNRHEPGPGECDSNPLRARRAPNPPPAHSKMKMTSRSFLPLVLVPLALASDWAGDKPSFQPKQGTTLSKRVSIQNELELDDMSMEVDGQDMSEIAGQIEVTLKVTTELAVTDSYESVSAGRPGKLKRSFDEISSVTHVSQSSAMAGDEEKDIPLKSELEGRTVVFSWDEDESSYGVAFDGTEGDAELLEDLEENLDLRGFLPASEVAQGDSWEIPAEAVKAALAPGGDVKLRPEGEADPMSGMNQFSQSDIIGELDGEFTAVYAGTREEDGKRVAVIQLKIEAQSARDMTEDLGEIQELMKGNMPPGLEMEISALDAEYEYEAEGELLWDLEASLAHGLSLSGEVRMIVDMSMSMKMGDNEQSMDISQTYVGTQTITLTTGD